MITYYPQFELVSMSSMERLANLRHDYKKDSNIVENPNYTFVCFGFPIKQPYEIIRVKSSKSATQGIVNKKIYNVIKKGDYYTFLRNGNIPLTFGDIYAEVGTLEIGASLVIFNE